jgi:cytochrome c
VSPAVKRVCAVLAMALIAGAPLAAAAPGAPDARALLAEYKCYICHADDAWKAGPAYGDVAAAYRGDPKASAALVRIIKRGQHGHGPWHMPPHPEVSDEEARVMARYILSLP